MLRKLRSFLRKFAGSSLQRSDYSSESRQHLENYDAVSARYDADTSDGGYDFPPNYVRPVDEGRPRK